MKFTITSFPPTKYMDVSPINTAMQVPPRINKEGYEVNPILLDILWTKQYNGYDTEDLYYHIGF